MKCKKCKENIENNLKFCPRCGTKVKHTGRRIVASLLILAILVGVAGFAGWKTGWLPFGKKNTNPAAEDFSLLTGSFTDRKITNQESALAAIGDVADDLGIEDVNAEFSECKVDTVSGNTYYRFYQEYQGIPVYGRSVVVAADAEGNCLSLSSNTSIISGLSTIEPSIDQASVKDSITKYISRNYGCGDNQISVEQIDSEALRIYCSNGKAKLAYLTDVRFNSCDNIGYYEFVVDADDGKILCCVPMLYEAIGYMASDADKENGFEVFQSDDGYFLWNLNSNLYVLNLNGVPSQEELTDSQGRILYDENGKSYTITHWGEGEFVISENEIFGDTDDEMQNNYEKGARLLINVDSISSCFKKLGFQNNAKVFLYYQDGYDSGNNALGGLIRDDIGVVSMGTNTGVDSIDVIAHEFTHFVSRSIIHWTGNNETKSINEAISDIFGELVESQLTSQEPDWENPYRNIRAPSGNCISNYSAYRNSLDCHYASTLVSHAAYLMYTGIGGGNPNFEALTTEDLAHLFYETLFTLPSDCTFSQFRTLVQNTAEMMYKQGRPGFSYKKVRSVSNAFFQVGIDPDVTPVSKKELSLDVYDIDGQPYNNYTLYVCNYSGAEKKYSGKVVAAEGISFPSTGGYELTIEDNANTDNRTTFKVQAIDTIRATKLPVFTRCGSGNTTPFETYIEAANRTTATGSWTEDIHMTAKMVVKKGNSTTKTKATMEASVDIEGWNGTDTSSLYMSGSASTSVLNQEIAYNMTWQNGMAHYEYTKPTVSSADLEIDPSYFNFNSLTDDMIISSAMTGNHITFSVKGDALTKAGISAVNDLLSGVENLSYDDATVNVTLNEQSGKIDMLTMTFRASMNYQGYDIEADYENHYVFSENDIQSEGDSTALLDGYWENMIQCYEDGSVNEYDAEPMAEVIPENLSYNYTLRYQLDGKKLVIDWGEGFKTTSESVTMDFPINDGNWNDSNIYFTYGLLNKS